MFTKTSDRAEASVKKPTMDRSVFIFFSFFMVVIIWLKRVNDKRKRIFKGFYEKIFL